MKTAIGLILICSAFACSADEVDQAQQQYNSATEKARSDYIATLRQVANSRYATKATVEHARTILDSIDIPKIEVSKDEWDKLQGQEFCVTAKIPAQKVPRISMKDGEVWVIVPHPEDVWYGHFKEDWSKTDWKGKESSVWQLSDIAGTTAMIVRVGHDGPWQKPGIIKGTGEIFIQSNQKTVEQDTGSIRVKIYRIR